MIPSAIVLRGESVNWFVRQHPTKFYPQDWYRSEPFAAASIVGVYNKENWPWPTAACLAAFLRSIEDGQGPIWPNTYLWTRDTDAEGNPVYVGRSAQYGGLQIHRSLTQVIIE